MRYSRWPCILHMSHRPRYWTDTFKLISVCNQIRVSPFAELQNNEMRAVYHWSRQYTYWKYTVCLDYNIIVPFGKQHYSKTLKILATLPLCIGTNARSIEKKCQSFSKRESFIVNFAHTIWNSLWAPSLWWSLIEDLYSINSITYAYNII